jgi:hypothetical protein
MSRELTNPLQALLATAAKTIPAQTGASAPYSRRTSATGPSVILADTSGSMSSAAWGGRRKIDVLREAVNAVRASSDRLVTFSSGSTEVSAIGEPDGSTALHLGLGHIEPWRPSHTLVISDGQPDNEGAALAAAERLTGIIDVLYVGPDGDRAAMDFMRRLARAGCGRMQAADIAKQSPTAIAGNMRLMLPPRKP